MGEARRQVLRSRTGNCIRRVMLARGSLTRIPLQRVLELELEPELQPELQPESELRPERVAVQVLQVMKPGLGLV